MLSETAVYYLDWFEMKADGLPPNEYWATAAEDIQIARALQRAVTHGVMRAEEEERTAREKERKAAEQKKREQESLNRLRTKRGG